MTSTSRPKRGSSNYVSRDPDGAAAVQSPMQPIRRACVRDSESGGGHVQSNRLGLRRGSYVQGRWTESPSNATTSEVDEESAGWWARRVGGRVSGLAPLDTPTRPPTAIAEAISTSWSRLTGMKQGDIRPYGRPSRGLKVASAGLRFGRHGSRTVCSRPSRLTVRSTQASDPKGRPRATHARSVSNICRSCAASTSASQGSGRSTGHRAIHRASSPPARRAARLPNGQSRACRTLFARTALASAYRSTPQQVCVRLHGKALVAPLIEVAFAHAAAVLAPAAHVRVAHPADELGQVAVPARPEDQVPVVVHQAVRQHPHARDALARLAQELDEGLEIAGLGEDARPAVAAVDHVINHAAGGGAGPPRHGEQRIARHRGKQEGRMSPCFIPVKRLQLVEIASAIAVGGRVGVSSGARPLTRPPPLSLSRTQARRIGCIGDCTAAAPSGSLET